jgi:hypothetical protein
MAAITSAVVPGALTRASRTAAVELVAAPDTPDLPDTDESCRGGGAFEGELLPPDGPAKQLLTLPLRALILFAQVVRR